MDAFDADVLIYAGRDNPAAGPLLALFEDHGSDDRVGSVLLIPELLSKPLRMGATEEVGLLAALLGRLDLYDVDRSIADAASAFGAKYRLRAADAVHLATAVHVGADRFITNNSRDFPKSIGEIEIVYPDDLA